jgi:phosphonate transport system permease protein
MSILAMTVAGLGALFFAFPAAANFSLPGGIFDSGGNGRIQAAWGAAVLLVSRGALLVARALSEAIWALLALLIFFPGIMPGAIGLGLYNLGVLGRLMAEVTENVDRRPLLALKGQGATNAQVFLYGVLPQTMPKNLAYILYRWEVCIRATVIAGMVGAGGLGRILAEQLSSFDYHSVVTSLLFYIGLTFIVDMISAAARRALR